MNCVNVSVGEGRGGSVAGFFDKWHSDGANGSCKTNGKVIASPFGSKKAMNCTLRQIILWDVAELQLQLQSSGDAEGKNLWHRYL